MAGFADILADIEAASFGVEQDAPTLRFGLEKASTQIVNTTLASAPLQGLAAAYLEIIETVALTAPEAPSPSLDEIAARFPTLLNLARRSPKGLSALRREMAWALHPDRAAGDAGAASRAMARFNAAIDAALAQCRPQIPSG